MIKLISITLIGIAFSRYANAATAGTNLNNGAICISKTQCKSGVCKNFSFNSVYACVPRAAHGEPCVQSTSNMIFATFPLCERGSDCTAAPAGITTNAAYYCVSTDAECETDNVWAREGYVDTVYVKYKHGQCAPNGNPDGVWETAYRCANGYYGISNSDVITTQTGCKKCPEFGICYEGYNESFHCMQGYYKSGDKCLKCPWFGTNADGTDTYGTTEYNLFEDAITQCWVAAGTYTDNSGTFDLGDTCYYTE